MLHVGISLVNPPAHAFQTTSSSAHLRLDTERRCKTPFPPPFPYILVFGPFLTHIPTNQPLHPPKTLPRSLHTPASPRR